jgi:hypothetical protein
MGLQDDVPLVTTASLPVAPVGLAKAEARQRSTVPAGPRNETEEHWLLKKLALGWAYQRGFKCISFEVRAPRSPYRVDVAGYRPAHDQESPVVALFECKQNRPDLDRDSAQTAAIEVELRGSQERRQNLERLLAVHFPTARTPSSLFPEWDPFDPERLPHSGYRRLIRRIMALQRKLEGNTKFERVTRYRLANLHFLVAPAGLVKSERVPPGWGLLELRNNEQLELLIQPRFYSITNGLDWLERICKNSTVRWLKTVAALAAETKEPNNPTLGNATSDQRPSPLTPLSLLRL